jgi:hypothetical protein
MDAAFIPVQQTGPLTKNIYYTGLTVSGSHFDPRNLRLPVCAPEEASLSGDPNHYLWKDSIRLTGTTLRNCYNAPMNPHGAARVEDVCI